MLEKRDIHCRCLSNIYCFHWLKICFGYFSYQETITMLHVKHTFTFCIKYLYLVFQFLLLLQQPSSPIVNYHSFFLFPINLFACLSLIKQNVCIAAFVQYQHFPLLFSMCNSNCLRMHLKLKFVI